MEILSYTNLALNNNLSKIATKRIVVVGIGGTGSNLANILTRLRFKEITFIDGDIVEESNLERQMLYLKSDIGKKKVNALFEKLSSFGNIKIIPEFLTKDNLHFLDSDLVIDATDNFNTRNLINTYCKINNIPWLYTGVIKEVFQIYLVQPNDTNIDKLISKTDVKSKDEGVCNYAVSCLASFAAKEILSFFIDNKKHFDLIRFNLQNYNLMKLKM